MTKEALDVTRSLATAVDHDVPVLKKVYLWLSCTLSDKAQKAQRKSVASTRKFSEQKEKIG